MRKTRNEKREKKEKKEISPKTKFTCKLVLYLVLVTISFQLSEQIALGFMEMLRRVIDWGLINLKQVFFAILIALYTYIIFKK